MIKMKHEIEIPDLPEGWEAVEAMIDPDGSYFGDDGNQYANAKIKLKKKQPLRIVLEETGNIRQSCYLLKIDDGNLILPPGREYKIAEDNKCAE